MTMNTRPPMSEGLKATLVALLTAAITLCVLIPVCVYVKSGGGSDVRVVVVPASTAVQTQATARPLGTDSRTPYTTESWRATPSSGSYSYSPARSEVSSSPTRERASGYKPAVAENGSYYGEISKNTGRPKTVHVRGYYRKDGTYVRGHYRSKPRR